MNIYKREENQLNEDNSLLITYSSEYPAKKLVKVLTNLGIYTESWFSDWHNHMNSPFQIRIPNDIDTNNFCQIVKDHRQGTTHDKEETTRSASEN